MVRGMFGPIKKIWRTTDRAIDRAVYWAGAYSLVSGIFSWVGSKLQFLQPYGWPEHVMFGVAVAAILFLVLSAGLVAWRYFKPVPAVAHPVETAPEPRTPAPPGNLTASHVSKLSSADLFTNDISFLEHASEGRKITLLVQGCNACRAPILHRRTEGSVVWEGHSLGSTSVLPSPVEIDARTAFMFKLVVEPIPGPLADALADLSEPVKLNLTNLKIDFSSLGDPTSMAHLPLWQGIIISENKRRTQTGKASYGSGRSSSTPMA